MWRTWRQTPFSIADEIMAQITIEQAFDLAVQHHQAGRLEEAERIYRQILAQQPDHAGAMHYLGVAATQSGRNDIAVDLIRRAIALSPDSSEAHNNLGNALCQLGQLDEAIAALRQAIFLRPYFAQAHNNLGNILTYKGQLDEAIAAYRRAITLSPGYVEVHNNLGNVLTNKGQLDEAIVAYRRAIELNPKLPEAYNNLGNALREKVQLDEAIAAYRQAIALRPVYPEAQNNLGNALGDNWQPDDSIAAYRQAITLRPSDARAHSNLALALHYHAGYEAEAIFEEHCCWNRQHAEPLRQDQGGPLKRPIQPHTNDRDPQRRLRVGYVSPDFRGHAVAPMVLPLLACHDHNQFEVFCYAQVSKPDEVTQRFRVHADQWRSTVGASDDEVAAQIRTDQIDILVDLAGHTVGNRLLVFARKPAPVQVTRQGYPNTTGLTTIDYRMTDAYADPPGLSDSLHSEQLIRLPQTNWIYQPPANCPEPSQFSPGASVTFGCFNNLAKVTEPMLNLWAKILDSVPGSRLILKARTLDSPNVRQRVQQIFRARNIAPQRVELLGWEKAAGDHLSLYHRIAIALDPFPYHGTTTTCEALWMGVPVITLAGQTHVSRVGVSLLANMGLEELIAQSPEEYIRIAVELANDHPRLDELHSNLRKRMENSPLMDACKFARNIEAAYRKMWHRYCALTGAAT